MKPEEFLTLHRKSRENWDDAISKIPVEKLTRSLPGRDWTLKDVIAHLTWHERGDGGHAALEDRGWFAPVAEVNG